MAKIQNISMNLKIGTTKTFNRGYDFFAVAHCGCPEGTTMTGGVITLRDFDVNGSGVIVADAWPITFICF